MKQEIIYYREGFKAILAKEYTILTGIHPLHDIHGEFYEIDTTGLMTIRSGYAWDYATGAFDTDSIKRASLIHDVGCQAIVDGLLDRRHKPQVDFEFKKAFAIDVDKIKNPIKRMVARIRVWYSFKAVTAFSCRGKSNPVISAPISS